VHFGEPTPRRVGGAACRARRSLPGTGQGRPGRRLGRRRSVVLFVRLGPARRPASMAARASGRCRAMRRAAVPGAPGFEAWQALRRWGCFLLARQHFFVLVAAFRGARFLLDLRRQRSAGGECWMPRWLPQHLTPASLAMTAMLQVVATVSEPQGCHAGALKLAAGARRATVCTPPVLKRKLPRRPGA